MGSSNENSGFYPVKNPRDLSRVPGGSSGGSAAVIAAGTAVASLGSDTGGSIRQPGAFCGVVGLKPTYGRVSRYGLIAFASSLDHVGPFGKTVKDVALILQHMAGRDPMDSTSADLPVPDYAAEIGKPVTGLRIGVPKEYFGEGLDPEVRAAVEDGIQELAKAGCEIVPVSLPHTEYAIPTYYLIATAEASSNLARFDGVRYGLRARDAKTLAEMYRKTRDAGFGTEVKRRIMLGTFALSAGYYDAYYLKAQKVRSLLARDFDEAFAKVDAIVTPTTPTPAFKLGEKADDPLAMYLADIYTVTANLVGVPGITVPCGKSKEGLPIGLQILGKHFDEATVLKTAHVVEHALARKRQLNRVVIPLSRASPAQNRAVPAHFALEVDALAALRADDALALVAGKFFRRHRDLHPLHGEQVLVRHLAVGQHLLLVLVLDLRMHLPRQRLGAFFGCERGPLGPIPDRRKSQRPCPSRETSARACRGGIR